MEMGSIEFMSFEEYKNRILKNNSNNSSNQNLSDEKIKDEMLKVVDYYEKKVGKKDGNI